MFCVTNGGVGHKCNAPFGEELVEIGEISRVLRITENHEASAVIKEFVDLFDLVEAFVLGFRADEVINWVEYNENTAVFVECIRCKINSLNLKAVFCENISKIECSADILAVLCGESNFGSIGLSYLHDTRDKFFFAVICPNGGRVGYVIENEECLSRIHTNLVSAGDYNGVGVNVGSGSGVVIAEMIGIF